MLVLGMVALMCVLEIATGGRADLDQHGIEPRENRRPDRIVASPFLHGRFRPPDVEHVPFVAMGLAIRSAGLVRVASVTVSWR